MPNKKNKRRRRSTSTLYKIHRYLGLFVAISLIWLSVSGVLLNHTGFFQLAKTSVDNPLVMKLYGMSTPKLGKVFKVGDKTVLQSGQGLFLDNKVLFEINIDSEHPLFSVVANNDMVFIGYGNQVKINTNSAELIDTIPLPSVELQQELTVLTPRLGIEGNNLYLEMGNHLFKANEDFTAWLIAEKNMQIIWSKEAVLSQSEREDIKALFSGLFQVKGPTLEQFLLDTHSGRLFGKAGVFFADLIAFLTILLTLIGVFLWVRRNKNRSKSKKRSTQ